ncbi:unnamed protein product [Leptidea sinapis]|uniref:TIL domain-containing protein n=1 Tax=Leptidea sinapis TaxID=189913 RepID=A0A5E4Q548_9NEOP|nr:unnamed protein product [Leptidea sinapis]
MVVRCFILIFLVSYIACAAYPCPKHEEYDPCPTCSESCSNASPDGERCRFPAGVRIGITVICEPKCRCKKYRWRDAKGNPGIDSLNSLQ